MNAPGTTRDRLLAVACELFSRQGFDAVSVRELTRRAAANLGAVTYHFGSKEALYQAAIERLSRPFADVFTQAANAPGSALDRLEAIVRFAITRNLSEHDPLLRELATDRPLPPPLVRTMQRNLGVVMRLIRSGQRDGSIRRGEPAYMALTLMTHALFFRVAGRVIPEVLGIDATNPRTRAAIVEHVAANLRRALAPRGAS